MKAIRATLVVAILLNLALLAVAGPLRSTIARYELTAKRQELRKISMENRALLQELAESRRPDRVAARAKALGVDLNIIGQENILSAAGSVPAAPQPALAPAARR